LRRPSSSTQCKRYRSRFARSRSRELRSRSRRSSSSVVAFEFLKMLVELISKEVTADMFGDALLASLPKVVGSAAYIPSSTLISSNPVREKRGWAVCFSTQFYPTPTFRAKSADIGMSAGHKASVACIVPTMIIAHHGLLRIGMIRITPSLKFRRRCFSRQMQSRQVWCEMD
jgi:hypothetical protein